MSSAIAWQESARTVIKNAYIFLEARGWSKARWSEDARHRHVHIPREDLRQVARALCPLKDLIPAEYGLPIKFVPDDVYKNCWWMTFRYPPPTSDSLNMTYEIEGINLPTGEWRPERLMNRLGYSIMRQLVAVLASWNAWLDAEIAAAKENNGEKRQLPIATQRNNFEQQWKRTHPEHPTHYVAGMLADYIKDYPADKDVTPKDFRNARKRAPH